MRSTEISMATGAVEESEWWERERQRAAWQCVQVARHPRRPRAGDFIGALISDFTELHGDRNYRDDPAIVGGLGRFCELPVMIVAQEKGRNMEGGVQRNFGMPFPEGYRKAIRLMQLADRMQIALLTFIDTPGAYPGLGAEQRGQMEAVARSLEVMATLNVPTVAAIIGEGGSGGALALGLADRVLMFENAIYSVISPEGCASILWHDRSHAPAAARALKLTAPEVFAAGLVDKMVSEPAGGAHQAPEEAFASLREALISSFAQLIPWDREGGRDARLARYLCRGFFREHNHRVAGRIKNAAANNARGCGFEAHRR